LTGYGIDVPDDGVKIPEEIVPNEIEYVGWIVMATVFTIWIVVVVVTSKELLLVVQMLRLDELVEKIALFAD
jgi:hypothetical protein